MSSERKAYTRRVFLRTGLTLSATAVTTPWFLQRSALAMTDPSGRVSSLAGVPEERVLVVLQLGGGNDGLNTVIPYSDPAYHHARPRLAIPDRSVLRLGRAAPVGLHPSMGDLKSLYDDALVSVLQGVGYPNPNRSHFASMDIWHTADPAGNGPGWLGRYIDNECAGRPDAGVSIGAEAERAMRGRSHAPVSFEGPDSLRWAGESIDEDLDAAYERINRAGDLADAATPDQTSFLMRTAMDARVTSDHLARVRVDDRPVRHPQTDLGRQFALVAGMIAAELRTRVYYVTIGGFDTHARQGGERGRHAFLLQQVSEALRAFYADLRATGHAVRVLTMVFSEFGRRVAQNGSNGTDHGAAAPMFLLGPMVRPGVLNPHPSLTDLDDGDLKHSVDFRSVYAGVLRDWMGADPEAVLGGRFRPARIVR
jgi:uncharacterized protein (DUF1501 family)